MENGVSLILPSYKEAENLQFMLPKINEALKKLPCPYEILVIDTVEPMDNTKEVCEQYGATYKPRENGNLYGDALRTGIQTAQYSKTAVMDSDGSHNPEDIVRLYEKMEEGYDLCVGSRYMKGGDTDNSFILKLMSYCLNLTFRILFNLNVKDVSNSLRMYDSEKLKAVKIECDNFDLVEEILIKMRYNTRDLRITEIPVYFNKRVKGESKRSLLVFILSYFQTIAKLWKFKTKAIKEK